MINVKYPFYNTFLDYPDDESNAVLVFVMGCVNKCEQCQNPSFCNYSYPDSIPLDAEGLKEEIRLACLKNRTNKVVLTGGDPLAPKNCPLIKEVLSSMPEIDFIVYTGHDIEYVKKQNVYGFKFIKCGKYVPSLHQGSEKTDDYLKLASKNQQLYDENLNLKSAEGVYYFA